MALTEEEKVQALQDAAIDFFMGLTTFSAWVNFVNNVTKPQVKNFLKNAIDQASNNYDNSSEALSTKANDYEDLSNQIDAL